MRKFRESGRDPYSQRADEPLEYEGHTPEDAATTELAVHNALRVIRGLMVEDRRRRARAGLPDLALPDEFAAEQGDAAHATRGMTRSARSADVRRRVLLYVAWTAGFAAVLLWPKTVLLGLFAMFVISLVGVALFGPEILERLREQVMQLASQHAAPRAARREARDEEMPEPRADVFEGLHDLRG